MGMTSTDLNWLIQKDLDIQSRPRIRWIISSTKKYCMLEASSRFVNCYWQVVQNMFRYGGLVGTPVYSYFNDFPFYPFVDEEICLE